MSVQIILSSKQIELDQYNHAVLNLKALFASLPPAIVALYKVRTNSKDMVDVRPSFGLLSSRTPQDAIATMQVKYMGSPEALKKMKLQVSWVWGEGIPERKLTHNEFSEMYANLKEKIGREKNHMLLFTTKDSAKKGQDSLLFHDKSKSSEASLPQVSEKEEEAMTEPSQPTQEDTPKRKRGSVGLKWIVVMVVTAFLLGILTGMKIQQAREETPIIVVGGQEGFKGGEQTISGVFQEGTLPEKEIPLEDDEDFDL